MSETIKLEPGPIYVGEPGEFQTFTDILANALAFAHAEVGTDDRHCAEFILRLLDNKGLVLGPKRLQFHADGSMGPVWETLPEPSREPLPGFQDFYAIRTHSRWPCKIGETWEHAFRRMAEVMAEYADEIRKRSLP